MEIVTIKRTVDTQMGRVLLVVMLAFMVTYVKQVSVLKIDIQKIRIKYVIVLVFPLVDVICKCRHLYKQAESPRVKFT